MQTEKKIFTLSILLIFSLSSCFAPTSKENYLQNFGRFVKNTEKNGDKFKKSDWKWANKRFTRYSSEWYDKFKDDLKMEEKIRVSTLKARYMAVKGNSKQGRFVNDNLKEDLDRLGEEVKEYLDQQLDEDMEEIKKGAREIGDSAVKVMQDVLKEIKKEKE